jgi:hypothetical protein
VSEVAGSRWRQKIVAGVNTSGDVQRSSEGMHTGRDVKYLLVGVSAEYFQTWSPILKL